MTHPASDPHDAASIAAEAPCSLYDGSLSTRDPTQWLWHVVTKHENPSVTAVVQTVDAGRGDLAVAAMR